MQGVKPTQAQGQKGDLEAKGESPEVSWDLTVSDLAVHFWTAAATDVLILENFLGSQLASWKAKDGGWADWEVDLGSRDFPSCRHSLPFLFHPLSSQPPSSPPSPCPVLSSCPPKKLCTPNKFFSEALVIALKLVHHLCDACVMSEEPITASSQS